MFKKISILQLCLYIIAIGIINVASDLQASNSYNLKMEKHSKYVQYKRQENLQKKIKEFQFMPKMKLEYPRAQIILAMCLMSMYTLQANAAPAEQALSSGQGSRNLQNMINYELLYNSTCSLFDTPVSTYFPSFKEEADTLEAKASKISLSLNNVLIGLKSEKHADYEKIKQQIPEFESDIIEGLYENVKYIARGTANIIFEGTLKQDRDDIKKGAKIAIRCCHAHPNINRRFIPNQVRAYARLSGLKGLTDYIPQIYGIYWGSYAPAFAHKDPYFSFKDTLLYIEMGFVEGTSYEKKYGGDYYPKTDEMMDARILFEHYIGKWSVERVGKVSINDADGDVLRHHLVTFDKDFAVYHIGNKSYVFEPGDSPRQIDYDDFYELNELYLQGKYSTECVDAGETDDYFSSISFQKGKDFMQSICDGKGLFDSIKEHFKDYEVSENRPLPATGSVKHYYMPDAYLDN